MLLDYKGLKIGLPYDVVEMEYIYIEEKINDHMYVQIRAIIEEDKAVEYMEKDASKLQVEVLEYNAHRGRNVPVFHGKITELAVECISGICILKIKAVSFTHDFDACKKSRTFCSSQLTYGETVKEVISSYGQKSVMNMAGRNEKTGGFLLQYQETDWEFMKRLATHFEDFIVADSSAGFGRLYFGVPKLNNDTKLEQNDYRVLRNMDSYNAYKSRGNEDMEIRDATYWEIESRKRLYLCEQVSFNNIACIVTRVSIQTHKDELRYTYRLNRRSGMKSLRSVNEKIFGISLPAVIEERKQNFIRVRFDIDRIESKYPSDKFFPYSIESSSWYCMPEVGSKVHIYFPENDEKKAMAIHAIRNCDNQAKYVGKIENPSEKSFSNSSGSEMKLTESDIAFVPDDSRLTNFKLEKSGIVKISSENISLESGNLAFGQVENPEDSDGPPAKPQKIRISAKENIKLVRMQNSVNVEAETHLVSDYIKLIGTMKSEPSIPASAYDQSSQDQALIDAYNAHAKAEIEKKIDEGKSKFGFGTMAMIIGEAALILGATVLTGGVAGVAMIAGAVSIGVAACELEEGKEDYSKSLSGDLSETYNPIRDKICGGNETAYNLVKYGSVSVAGLSVAAAGGTCKIVETALDTGINTGMELIQDYMDDGEINRGVDYYLKNATVNIGMTSLGSLGGSKLGFEDMEKGKKIFAETILDTGLTSLGDVAATGDTDITDNFVSAILSNTIMNNLFSGDPVNVATGSLYVPATDIVIQDIGCAFKLERKYNSVNNKVGVMGRGWFFKYESRIFKKGLNLVLLCDDGHVEEFEFNNGEWENTKGKSRSYEVEYDTGKKKFEVIDHSKKQIFIYDDLGFLVEMVDQNGNRAGIEYNGANLKRIKTFSNNIIDLICEDGKIVQISDEIGRTVQYKYEGDYLTHVVHVDCGITRYEYDEGGRISSITDQNGNTYTVNRYDRSGRVEYQKYSTGEECTISYDDDNMETSFYFKKSGRIERYRYDRNYLVTHIIHEDGTSEEYGYDIYRNRILEKDRNGNIKKLSYDEYGNLTREIFPDGFEVEYRYDEKSNLTEKLDNCGGRSEYEYDVRGNMLSERKKISSSSWSCRKYEYDMYGRVLSDTDPAGNKKRFEYPIGPRIVSQPEKILDSEGNAYEYEYDAVGRNTLIRTDYGEIEFGYNRLNHVTSIRDSKGNTTRKYYDKMGNLTKLVTPENYDDNIDNGPSYDYKYDSMDSLIEIRDPLGNIRRNIRNEQGSIVKEINPNYLERSIKDGLGISYEYDKDGRKLRNIYPDGGIERMFYDSKGNLIKRVSPEYYDPEIDDGPGYSYRYDCMDRLVCIIRPDGSLHTEYEYDLSGNIAVKRCGTKDATTYKYDLAGNVIEKRMIVDQESGIEKYSVTLYEYDLNSNKIKERHGIERVEESCYPRFYNDICFAYDKNNRLVEVWDKSGAKACYGYDCLNNRVYEKIRVNDRYDKITRYEYDSEGRLSKRTEEIGQESASDIKTRAVTSYEYDKNGNNIKIRTPKGNIVKREYDKSDRLISETNIDRKNGIKRRVEYAHDRCGNIIAVQKTGGSSKRYTYDAKNRLTHVKNELENTTRLFYDKNDRLIKEVLPKQYDKAADDGRGYTYEYDIDGRLLEKKNPLGFKVETNTYDEYGNRISAKDGCGNATEYLYGFLGRLKEVSVSPENHEKRSIQKYRHDARGNITGVFDGNGNETTYVLDDWGRIKRINTSEGACETYDYDYAGNISSATDANGNTVYYEYNGFNKISRITDQEGFKESFTYDEEGNLAEHADRNGNRITYEYNMDGNLVSRRGSGCEESGYAYEEFSYNEDGTLKTAKSNSAAYTYEYTADKRLKSKSSCGRKLLEYDYDGNGNVESLTDITGQSAKYSYDDANRMENISDAFGSLTASYEYNPNDTIKKVSYANGISTSYEYDCQRNMSRITTRTSSGEALMDYSYKRDSNGNILEIDKGDDVSRYSYDGLNRLTEARYGQKWESYIYDAGSNRIGKSSEAGQEKYFYNSKNQLLRVLKPDEELGFEYDKNGNTIRQESGNGTDVYEYDSLNRMVKAVTAKGDSLACRYDAFGLRIEMEENEKLYGFIFDAGKVVVELDDSDKPKERYIRGKGLVAKDMDGSRYYYHSDALSSTMFITDSDGERKNSYSYDAFGVMVDREESIKNRMTYAGEQYDSITGQYYLRARYYNPDIGRFTQEDIYRGDGLNLYAYCGNNPVAYVDPSGYAKKKPNSGNCSVNKENAFADTAEGVSNPETYYRTMSQADYDYLRMTGELPSTGETFISPTKAFSDNYKGATVEFKLNPGTTSQLENIGLRNNAMLTKKVYPNMNSVSGVKGWNENFTLFKAEGNQINIGLGKGKGLEIFNSNIDSFMRVGGK